MQPETNEERSPGSAGSMIAAVWSRKMLLCVLTGFSSGMPIYVLLQLVPAWLRSENVDLSSIGWLGLAQLPYSLKLLWAPFMDRYAPPLWGRRRGWALVSQVVLIPTLASLAWLDPAGSLESIGLAMGLIAFASASQDVALDAYRREILEDAELGLGNSVFTQAYRLSSLVPGSLGLVLADQLSWSSSQLIVASFMAVGLITTWAMPEPPGAGASPPGVAPLATLWAPVREFLGRHGPRRAIEILAFMLLYKLGDSMATALATPFYVDLGFSNTEIGTVAKFASLTASAAGALLGGLVMVRLGIDRALWVFGGIQLISILGFAALSEIGPNAIALGGVVAFEYLGVGLGTAGFTAFLARTAHPPYTGAQLALFTSVIGGTRTFSQSVSGELIERLGYTPFFLLCTALALPGLLLLRRVAPWPSDPLARRTGVDQGRHE